MYSRSEADESSNLKYNKYESVFHGYYYYYYTSGGVQSDEIVVLGCKTYQEWAHSSTWTISMTNPSTADPVYGLCMKGWIHTIEIWTTGTAGYWAQNWDYVFNADLPNERTDLDNLIQGFIYKSYIVPIDKTFKIGTYSIAPYPLYMAPT